MVKFAVAATFFVLTGLASASPAPLNAESNLEKRFNLLSGQWDSENIGNGQYMLYNNLWGKSKPGTSGSQSTQALSYSGTTIGWRTQYSWSGNPNDVKSYANAALLKGLGKRLSAIKTIPTTWRWTYSAAASDLVANVSYDLWLSNVPNGTGHSTTSTYEIMIWLSNRRAGPAGSQVATTTIGGQSWKVFKGRVETWDVYSFVASNELTNYNADLKPFFTYLSSSHGVSLNQYLVALQAGTEPFQTETGTLTTTAYTAAIN
ncbi:Glycosyl hydrolase family 12 [Rhizoctonia solani]|uniref:Glycosyl hydrolase family 12 n=1 Tax=Rhizoctonia solani TaxID=456999 RepID=A0A8H7HCH9_9AGAM|nr:Glycosyl hydrolase family 12 [Rhizoctonia solani]